jgi:hypothetical protein
MALAYANQVLAENQFTLARQARLDKSTSYEEMLTLILAGKIC